MFTCRASHDRTHVGSTKNLYINGGPWKRLIKWQFRNFHQKQSEEDHTSHPLMCWKGWKFRAPFLVGVKWYIALSYGNISWSEGVTTPLSRTLCKRDPWISRLSGSTEPIRTRHSRGPGNIILYRPLHCKRYLRFRDSLREMYWRSIFGVLSCA